MDANLARFSIVGNSLSTSDDRGYDGEHGEELSFRLESPALVSAFELQVYHADDPESPRCSKGAPALTLVGSTSGAHVVAASPAADITTQLPVSGTHAWIVRATAHVAGSAKRHIFERIIVIRNDRGLRKIIPSESTAYEEGGWAEAVNEIVEAVDAAGPTGPAFGAIGPGELVGNATGATAAPQGTPPNQFDFELEGTTTKAGFHLVSTTTSVEDSGSATATLELAGDGLYTVTVLVTATGGLIAGYSFHCTRISGTVSGAEMADPMDLLANAAAGTESDPDLPPTFGGSDGDISLQIENNTGGTIDITIAAGYTMVPFP